MEFQDKVALVTGGTSGIGLAVASQLAEKGAKVVIVGRCKEKGEIALEKLKKIHSDIEFLSVDVTKGERVKRMIDDTISRFGRLDFAFNNAVNDEVKHSFTHEFSEEDYDHLMEITLKSVWLCMKYEIQEMLSRKMGVIVNTSSIDALLCSAGAAVYSAGKSGVIALSKSASQEYGRHGIRINSVSPGPIRTPLLEKKFSGLSSEEAIIIENRYKELNALGRIGTADEAASVVMWLFSEQASYVTGQNIVVDGGVSMI